MYWTRVTVRWPDNCFGGLPVAGCSTLAIPLNALPVVSFHIEHSETTAGGMRQLSTFRQVALNAGVGFSASAKWGASKCWLSGLLACLVSRICFNLYRFFLERLWNKHLLLQQSSILQKHG